MPDYLYIYKQDILDQRRIYKVGWTTDVFQRENQYKTISPFGRMVFAVECGNAVLVEENLLRNLKSQYKLHSEVVYDINFEDLKSEVQKVLSTKKSTIDADNSSEGSVGSYVGPAQVSAKSVLIPRSLLQKFEVLVLKTLASKFGGFTGKKDAIIQFLINQKLSVGHLLKPELQAFLWALKTDFEGSKNELVDKLIKVLHDVSEQDISVDLLSL